jgi:hypothetical protein
MPWADRSIDMEFDFIDHVLVVRDSHGALARISLEDRSVADFYREVMRTLDDIGVNVSIRTMPSEFANPIPFPDDEQHHSYDREAVGRFFDALSRVAAVMHEHRGRFRGKTSPVHFFWGTFDLANTRYSGAPADPPPDADLIIRRSHDAEQIAAGFWAGDDRFQEAAFYAYAYPQPEGIEHAAIGPPPAFWNAEQGLLLLRYEDVRTAPDPAASVREFLQSTYAACASLLGWSPSLVASQ